MDFTPRVSVVIPLYNKESTIGRAIASVLAQGAAPIEIIVVDDGSTDASAARVEAMADPHITLVRQANAGPGAARNAGAARARGELLAFLDADDEWLPGFLEAALGALDSHPQALAYACGYDTRGFTDLVVDKVSQVTDVAGPLPPPAASIGGLRLAAVLNALHSSAAVVRRAAFETAGGFYDRERCLWGEDSFLWAQILFMGPLYWDPQARIVYHLEDSDLGFAVKRREKARPLALFADEIERSLPPEHREAFRALARATGIEDSYGMMRTGQLLRSVALTTQLGLWNHRTLAGSALRYAAYLRERVTGGG
ncbi:glycosyltransferase family 2 protein [Ancylobacter terrae]|uniref:glycosyltransferase family 2 protein n=1 Tax=Ancylobacter sp. sgz301288 TaxID=3342077 RepID=UPI00385BA701